jgi:hypothetical protein
MSTAGEPNPRKRRLIIYQALASLFLVIGALFFSINHIFSIWGCPFLLIGFIFAAFALRLTLINHKSTHATANRWWCILAVPGALLCCLLLWVELKPTPMEPKPHFKLAIKIGDFPIVFLTNDFLFRRRIVKIGDLSKGRIVANTFANGCLIIPVPNGQSNMVFNFVAVNDSSLKVNDLMLFAGFPKALVCGYDSAKWHKADESLIVPNWQLDATNMQYIAAQCPYVLSPYDSVTFPAITNPYVPEYIGSTFKGGFIDVTVRSTDFENILGANIILIPVETNSFNPFITLGHLETDGTLRITPTPQELEAAQQ